VPDQDVADRRLQQRVVRREDAAAGQSEDDLDRLLLEALDERLRSGELRGGSFSGAEKRIRPPGWEVEEHTRRVRPVC
jgi:hypothetical protein